MEPGRLQRSSGVGEIAVHAEAGRTRLDRLYQEGSAKIRLPTSRTAGEGLEAVLINTAGGLAGGDRMSWRAEVGDGARLTLTTQASEKVYRALSSEASVAVRLRTTAGGRIDWLPQETILFDQARLTRTLDVDLDTGGTLLAVEANVLGRRARGEVVASGALRDRWTIRRNGRLIFVELSSLEGPISRLARRAAALGDAGAYALTVLVSPDAEDKLARVRAELERHPGVRGGVSAFDGKLLCRLIAQDGFMLRRALVPTVRALRDGLDMPRVWTL